MPEILNKTTRLHYDDTGSGAAIVWVHGYPLDRTMWGPQVAELSTGFRHIVPDLRGFGQSDAPDQVYSMDCHADDLAAIMDAARVDRAVICGLSMGGYVSLAFARRHPSRMRALILADTRATADTPEAAAGRRQSAERALKEGVAPVVEPMLGKLLGPGTHRDKPDVVSHVKNMMLSARPAGVAGALRGMADRPDSRPTLSNIHVPTLVVVGEQDVITPPTDSEELARHIDGARLVRIADAGHMPNLEQPTAFNSALRDFLRTL